MDGVLFDYWKRFRELQNDLIRLPQTTYGFYTSLEPIDGAIEAFKWLWEHFEVFILTRPSYQNPMCYTEKRVCVENHLGIEAAKNLIISYDKTLFIGDALIDDTQCDGFQGEMILFGSERFGNWTTVIKYLSQNYLND
jgi:5'(3')-deoxyribonucleotidase